MYWTNNQRLSFFSILFLLLYFIKEILSLGIRTDITMETKDTIYVIELKRLLTKSTTSIMLMLLP